MRLLLFITLLLKNLIVTGQITYKLKAGVNIGNFYIQKTRMREIDSLEHLITLKTGKTGSGGVAYCSTPGTNQLFISHSTLSNGLGIVCTYRKDPNAKQEEITNFYRNGKVYGITISKPNSAIDEKGNRLIGMTEKQVLKFYHKDTITYYDNLGYKVLIDSGSGICFLFDPKTKKCIEIEVFQKNGYCFKREYDKVLKHP